MEKNFFEIIDKEIRLKFNSKAELARQIGTTRASINFILKKIESGQDIKFSTLKKICDAIGYKIILKKK